MFLKKTEAKKKNYVSIETLPKHIEVIFKKSLQASWNDQRHSIPFILDPYFLSHFQYSKCLLIEPILNTH